jgi:hypothetical protein
MEENDYPPIIRVDLGNGRAIYPQFKKNTEGKWELKDKSFQKMLFQHPTSEKPAEKDKD